MLVIKPQCFPYAHLCCFVTLSDTVNSLKSYVMFRERTGDKQKHKVGESVYRSRYLSHADEEFKLISRGGLDGDLSTRS